MSRFFIFLVITLFSLNGICQDISTPDTLYKICSETHYLDEIRPRCGYVNQAGDTIIGIDEYIGGCFEDTIVHFFSGFLTDSLGMTKLFAITPAGLPLFEIYWADGWPDKIHDGRVRYVENGKIGYADSTGKIIIKAIYTCASQFKNGQAYVSVDCITSGNSDLEHESIIGGTFSLIDKFGNKID